MQYMSILLPIVHGMLLIIRAKSSFSCPTDCRTHGTKQLTISQFRLNLHGLDETVSQGTSTFTTTKGLINQSKSWIRGKLYSNSDKYNQSQG